MGGMSTGGQEVLISCFKINNKLKAIEENICVTWYNPSFNIKI